MARLTNLVLAASWASRFGPRSGKTVRSVQNANIRSSTGTRKSGRPKRAVVRAVHSIAVVPAISSDDPRYVATSSRVDVAGSQTASDGAAIPADGGGTEDPPRDDGGAGGRAP